MMKKIFVFVIVFALALSGAFSAFAAPLVQPEFDVYSQAVYLVNLDVDKVIYEKNKDLQIAPASLVKIMSSILVLEAEENLDRTIEAPASIFNELYGLGASNAGILAGEEVMVSDLLHAMLMASACEAASILAYEYGGGDVSAFVDKMNARAKELGANNTVFRNPHGLDADGQITTAYDMYLIVSHALTLPMFEKIASTVKFELSPTNKHSQKQWIHHTNVMLDRVRGGPLYYVDMLGLKTGTTALAGKNMITLLRKNGYSYLLITLGANNDKGTENLHYQDHRNFYDWVIKSFGVKTVIAAEETIPNEMKVRLSEKKDHMLVVVEKAYIEILPKDIDVSNIARKVNLPESIDAPVQKGDVLGTLSLSLAGEKLGEVNLIAGEDIKRSTLLSILDGIGKVLTSPWFLAAVMLIILVIAAYVFYAINVNKRRRGKVRGRSSNSIRGRSSSPRNRGSNRFRT
jgi:D-alanyl-D-alanine carboxypeptidase